MAPCIKNWSYDEICAIAESKAAAAGEPYVPPQEIFGQGDTYPADASGPITVQDTDGNDIVINPGDPLPANLVGCVYIDEVSGTPKYHSGGAGGDGYHEYITIAADGTATDKNGNVIPAADVPAGAGPGSVIGVDSDADGNVLAVECIGVPLTYHDGSLVPKNAVLLDRESVRLSHYEVRTNPLRIGGEVLTGSYVVQASASGSFTNNGLCERAYIFDGELHGDSTIEDGEGSIMLRGEVSFDGGSTFVGLDHQVQGYANGKQRVDFDGQRSRIMTVLPGVTIPVTVNLQAREENNGVSAASQSASSWASVNMIGGLA